MNNKNKSSIYPYTVIIACENFRERKIIANLRLRVYISRELTFPNKYITQKKISMTQKQIQNLINTYHIQVIKNQKECVKQVTSFLYKTLHGLH